MCLIEGDLERLSLVDAQLSNLSQQARALESERIQIVVDQQFNPQEGLESLIQQSSLSIGVKKGLQDARHRLKRQLYAVDCLQHEVGDLLRLSIDWVNRTVSMIAKAAQGESESYNAKGQSDGDSTQQIFKSPQTSTIERKA
jgi:hypothetical protein